MWGYFINQSPMEWWGVTPDSVLVQVSPNNSDTVDGVNKTVSCEQKYPEYFDVPSPCYPRLEERDLLRPPFSHHQPSQENERGEVQGGHDRYVLVMY